MQSVTFVESYDPTLNPASNAPPVPRRAFASFASRDFRTFFLLASVAMMADNIEHVISYWVIFQKFHSSALGAFAVVSHWVPYLLFAGYTGSWADRYDIRRLIQLSMLMFICVSLGWGYMFMTDSTEEWKAMVLLVIHGLAGVVWSPAVQVMIHRIVPSEQLPSAVRLIATGRYAAFVLGPALGSGILLAYFGPVYGIFINALIYIPMVIWLQRVPYGKQADTAPKPQRLRGFADIAATIRVVSRHPVLSAMTLMIGAAAFFIGNAYQAQMPGFAVDLGHDRPGGAYSALLGADAAGGLLAGIILETGGWLSPSVRSAFILAMIWCVSLGAFAQSASYALAIPLLFIAGFVELGFNSMAQSLVQLHAPGEIRGRVIGVFSMASGGLRTFSGLSVGLLGAVIGIHNSLALCAAVLFLVLVAVSVFVWNRRNTVQS
jgi:MFS family permease